MKWIVLDEVDGKIRLVSKSEKNNENGLIHNGAYLTIEKGRDKKFILRVDSSIQLSLYSPSPLIVDMELPPLIPDSGSKNLVYATRIMEIPDRKDGRSSFIEPQTIARLSTQDEIDLALGNMDGFPVFMASAFGRNNQILIDNDGKLVVAKVPVDVFFHQILITGRTGSGKTVAMKYMAQYFTKTKLKDYENQPGAVLAVNVKEEDLLKMDKPSSTNSDEALMEWKTLGLTPEGVRSYRIYYPGHSIPNYSNKVDRKKCVKITLKTENLNPESLSGLIQNLSVQGSEHLPAIFRYWQKKKFKKGDTLGTFLTYFSSGSANKTFSAMNINEEIYDITLHPGTFSNLQRSLARNTQYFDVEDAIELNPEEILEPGKMSVIDVSNKEGITFGAVLLRDILEKIYDSKSNNGSKVPVLIIIDEVHEFYGDTRSKEALQTLDTITRKGRSLGIGVVFSSQNPEDMPKGINTVVNTKIHFRSDSKNLAMKLTEVDVESLKEGFAVTQIYGMSPLRFIKFPLSPGGV